jgi:hypothetical protein
VGKAHATWQKIIIWCFYHRLKAERKMATSEERLKVLHMIQEGKISAAEGMKLLDALGQSRNTGTSQPTPPTRQAFSTRGARWFRVRVTDTDTGRVRVNIRLPVTVVTAGVKLGARFSPEVEGLDMKALMDSIQAGETGQIVDVYDENDGEHVEVFLE